MSGLECIAEALVIRPGDVLIVRVPWRTSHEHAEMIKERLAELLPHVETKVVIAAEQIAVYRPRPG